MPESLSVEIHEESSGTAHLVLPPDSKLSRNDLRAVAGGFERHPGFYNINW